MKNGRKGEREEEQKMWGGRDGRKERREEKCREDGRKGEGGGRGIHKAPRA